MIEYKGYTGKIEYDNEAEIFFGEVIDLNDVITFQGESVKEIKQAFADSVEDYLAFCAEVEKTPEKPFSGKLSLRLDPDLHRSAAIKAKLEDKSLNRWLSDVIKSAVSP